MRPKKRILAVGADADSLGRLAFLLGTVGFAVAKTESAAEARQLLQAGRFDLLVCEGCGLEGLEGLLDAARAADSGMRTLLLRGDVQGSPALFATAILTGSVGAAELVERCRVLVARPRGPKRKGVQVASVERLLGPAGRAA